MPWVTQIGWCIVSRRGRVIGKPGQRNQSKIGKHRDKKALAIGQGVEPGIVQTGVDLETRAVV